MADATKIQWTDATWNPWHGCHKISPGCKLCYMFAEKRMYGQDPDKVVRSKTTFTAPLKWKDPRNIFTCSWSDWLIEEADAWRDEAYVIIRRTPHHTYQILTKRIERAAEHWPADLPNAWLGVSVEDRKYGLPRIDILREIPAALRFLSIEPQLEDLGKLNLEGIDWVIIGGESGHGARPFDIAWARSIVAQCKAAGVACFIKQFGGAPQEIAFPKHVTDAEAANWMRDGWTRIFDTNDNSVHWRRYFKLRDKKGGDLTELPGEWPRQFPEACR